MNKKPLRVCVVYNNIYVAIYIYIYIYIPDLIKTDL